MSFIKQKLSPVARITLGLVSQAVSLIVLLSLFFGVMPDHIESARKLQAMLSEKIAQQTVNLLQTNDIAQLERHLQQALPGDHNLRSIGVRRSDGLLVAEAGAHEIAWQASQNPGATLDRIIVPISTEKLHWGDVEFTFNSVSPTSLWGWVKYPPVATIFLISTLAFIAFYLYLRRALQYLDPLAVIPERVRMAYDTFQEALLVLDTHGRIVLANAAFRRLHPAATENLSGKAASSLDWFIAGIQKIEGEYPWLHAMKSKSPIVWEQVEIPQPDQEAPIKIVLNCAPIQDGYGNSRGCMVVLSDVTALHQTNEKLLQALHELAASKLEVEEKNKELANLATRDPLTGCLNRRALFEAVGGLLQEVKSKNDDMCCIMGDIDHFKNFNDQYGHSIGDQVIKAVARHMGFGLREGDLLCRYGGEEFCIFLPGIAAEQAMEIAERLRFGIESEAGQSIRAQDGLRVTSSFGLASLKQGATTPEMLIDRADDALYQSKRTGRNRVTLWSNDILNEL